MEGWTIGVIVILVLGLVAIVYGALADRAKTNRARREILNPPDRDIPRFSPDTAPPHYLSELQARRPHPNATTTALTEKERTDITTLIKSDTTTAVTVGYGAPSFVTDPTSGWAVLADPRVLVCADPVTSFRELLPIVERHLLSQTPLVVAAPDLSKEALSTLEVNHIQQMMRVLAVTRCDADQLRAIAEATRAEPCARADLQSGYVTPQQLGTCRYWVSDDRHSYVIIQDAAG